MSHNFEFKVHEPTSRHGNFVLPTTYFVYKVEAQTTLENYARKMMEVERRYSDFEWLRDRLAHEYPFCIIPPVPEKSASQGSYAKVTGHVDQKLLEYRQRALRKFLTRVGAHPHLHNAAVLKDFLEMETNEWNDNMKAPRDPQSDKNVLAALALNAASLGSHQWAASNLTPQQHGEAYVKALSDPPVDPAVWKDAEGYITQLETSICRLRAKMEDLVGRRRETSSALCEFGRSFRRVGEIEGSMDNGPTPLSNAIISVSDHSDQLSRVYIKHADREGQQVVETLTYYLLLCGAVREALKRLMDHIKQHTSAVRKVEDLTSQKTKLVQKGTPDKVHKLEEELTAANHQLTTRKLEMTRFEELFKEELRRFHREKQYDVKGILKSFTDLQMNYATEMKRSWEALQSTVELKAR
eukprot:Tbor_TRINITY_DN4602_c0_g1::TRINITY_DN4602_c0_g1_i1::g.14911::m.14911/K17917/SNX1_2; sorting nexin-1/2